MTGCPAAGGSPITSLHRSKGGSVGGGDGKGADGADAASELLSDGKSLTELGLPNDTEQGSGSEEAQALMGAVSSTIGSKLGRKTLDTQSEGNCSPAHRALLVVGPGITMPATHKTTAHVHASARIANRVSTV